MRHLAGSLLCTVLLTASFYGLLLVAVARHASQTYAAGGRDEARGLWLRDIRVKSRPRFEYFADWETRLWLLQAISRRHFIHIAVLVELADQARIDQLFDFDVRRFGALYGHQSFYIS